MPPHKTPTTSPGKPRLRNHRTASCRTAERSSREAAGEYPAEPLGSGTNEFQYFVCHRLGDAAFTRLPDARPEHIRAARALKRLLVGHLAAPVSTFPPFPWTEAEFLRAQIARIGAATVLAPAGWFSQEEDEAGGVAVVPAEEELEPVPMPEEDMDAWLGNWVHLCVSASLLWARGAVFGCCGRSRSGWCMPAVHVLMHMPPLAVALELCCGSSWCRGGVVPHRSVCLPCHDVDLVDC